MHATKLILGTYNTMPEGLGDRQWESVYQRSWRPFLSSLYKFQDVSAVLHYSGLAFQWIEEHHPEFILLLEEMAGGKQIELLGGGFFSPLFPLLQPSDKIGQIEMLTTYLRKTFGRRPTGGWLYEYAWDPSLPFVLRSAGLGYTFLPQANLAEAGLLKEGSFSPFLTEDQRRTLYVFPTLEPRRSEGPLPPLERIVESLRAAQPEEGLVSVFVDGLALPAMWEASGLESPDLLFEKSFAWFQKNCLDLETVTAREAAKNLKSAPLVYLGSCASERMARAAGGPGAQVLGIKHAMAADERTKRLYDKMCQVHNLTSLLRGDKARKKSAQEDLWRAQCGELYWSGASGGLHNPLARLGAFRALIEAEKTTRLHGTFSPGLLMDDLDCDGAKEILYQAGDLNCYIHERGGSVFELDLLRSRQDLCAVSMPGMTGGGRSFLDSFSAFGSFEELILDLSSQTYAPSERDKGPQKVGLQRDFSLRQAQGSAPMSLRKAYLFQKHGMSVDVELVNRSTHEASFRFVSELRLQLSTDLGELGFVALRGRDELELPLGASEPGCLVEGLAVKGPQGKFLLELRSDKAFWLRLDHVMELLPAPLESRAAGSADEGGGLHYQGTRLRFGWDLALGPDAQALCSLSLHFGG